jgi:hypothetical protein
MNKLTMFIGLAITCALPMATAGERPNYALDIPEKVAVITSSGVDGDKRTVDEYDDILKQLGWKFDKYMNTELKDVLAGRHGHYDLILGTSLWNFGDPQNMDALVPLIRNFFNHGGVMILTDSSYPSMINWFGTLDPELGVETRLISELGSLSSPDYSQASVMLKSPYDISSGLNNWACFSKWGRTFTPMIRTLMADSAFMLGAPIGDGVLIVTTCFNLPLKVLQNAYASANVLKNRIEICPVFAPPPRHPGEWNVALRITNATAAKKLKISATITSDKSTTTVPIKEVTVGPSSNLSLSYPLTILARGRSKVEIAVNNKLIAVRDVVIPEMLVLKCNRPVLAKNDELVATIELLLPEREIAHSTVQVSLIRGTDTIPLFAGPGKAVKTVKMPAAKIGVGKWQLTAVVAQGREKTEQRVEIEVRAIAVPPTKVVLGKRGELLVNGKTMFPLGVYHCSLDLAKKMGFNCVTGYGDKDAAAFPSYQSSLSPEQLKWFERVDAAGLKVLPDYSDYVRSPDFKPENLRRIVAELRLIPANLASYVVDEPSIYGIPPQQVSAACDLLRECDPDHPVLLVEVPSSIAKYARFVDVLAVDPYPISTGICENLAPSIADAVEAAAKVSGGRSAWAVIQVCRLPPATPARRYPTPAEVRCMAYIALNHGAKGLLFYAAHDVYQLDGKPWPSGFQFDKSLMDALPKLLLELSKTGPAYVMGNVIAERAPKNAAELDVVRIEHNGQITRIIVNPTSRPLKYNDINIEPFEVNIQALKP